MTFDTHKVKQLYKNAKGYQFLHLPNNNNPMPYSVQSFRDHQNPIDSDPAFRYTLPLSTGPCIYIIYRFKLLQYGFYFTQV